MIESELPLILPDNILRSLVCHECFQYLSVGPVTINDRGEWICGRCMGDQAESLYNVLAQGFKFKCTNHINGCNEVLIPAEMKNHEQNCPYKLQECFFCSFSGNLSQIVNHSSQCHPENITFDGQFMFSLSDLDSKKTLLYLFNNNLYLVTIEITKKVVKIYIQLQNQKVTANHFAIKFFKSEHPSDSLFILTDYGLLHDKFPSYFEKSMEHLKMSFGSGAILCCQILIDDVELMVEIQKCYAMLRKGEEKLAQLQNKADSYNTATDIIKRMSHTFFKCNSCLKACTIDSYFCENFHVSCNKCVTTICKVCYTTMGSRNPKGLEDFQVPCDFADCNKVVKISQYLYHKLNCSKRPYKCPLENCNEVVLSAEKLMQHWHSEIPKLCFDKTIEFKTYKTGQFYWLLGSDLYRVLVNFSKEHLSVLIDEVNVLNEDKLKFKCAGGIPMQDIPMSFFCGKSHVNLANRGYDYTRLRIIAPP